MGPRPRRDVAVAYRDVVALEALGVGRMAGGTSTTTATGAGPGSRPRWHKHLAGGDSRLATVGRVATSAFLRAR